MLGLQQEDFPIISITHWVVQVIRPLSILPENQLIGLVWSYAFPGFKWPNCDCHQERKTVETYLAYFLPNYHVLLGNPIRSSKWPPMATKEYGYKPLLPSPLPPFTTGELWSPGFSHPQLHQRDPSTPQKCFACFVLLHGVLGIKQPVVFFFGTKNGEFMGNDGRLKWFNKI